MRATTRFQKQHLFFFFYATWMLTKTNSNWIKTNRLWMSRKSWNMFWAIKRTRSTSRIIHDKQFDDFIPNRRKTYFHHPFLNDVKSSKILLLCNVSFISLRYRLFFYDEFSKKYEYTIDDTCNKRFPERDTKPFQQRIKTRIPVSMTMTFVILLRAYFLMFRQIKILIFNSWFTTDDILLSYNYGNLFCDRIRRLDFQNWSSVCVSATNML